MRPPSVDALAKRAEQLGVPHPAAVEIARRAIAGGDLDAGSDAVTKAARAWQRERLGSVVNATGVLLHTNIGRAPIRGRADAGFRPARYSNLEIDLATGRRGSRQAHVEPLVCLLTGAERALVVNNGAAAVLLVLTALAKDREVIVSRGELVEIGGGFRLPAIFEACGARLVEVGTTNRTYLSDYEGARSESTAAILQVHRSNFTLAGFTASVGIRELASVGIPVIADIGSGLLDASMPWLSGPPPHWLGREPAARQSLAAGAALVTFSGDKLLGGPQAGVLAGKAELIEACERHPLARALRPGGLVLAALEATLVSYLERRPQEIPFWAIATVPAEELRQRADRVWRATGQGRVTELASLAGGGSSPGAGIPSWGLALDGDFAQPLLDNDPPVLGRVEGGRTLLDLRTVHPDDDEVLVAAVKAATSRHSGPST